MWELVGEKREPRFSNRLEKSAFRTFFLTGKTAFAKRLVHDSFTLAYKATIGVDFTLKVKKVDKDVFRLQLWDIAGQERFGNMTRVYYKEAVGAFIMVDCTRPSTFDAVKKWKSDIDSKIEWPEYSLETNPVILLINKIDLLDDTDRSELNYDDFCKEYGFHSWIAISNNTGEGIEEACDAMIEICKNVVPVVVVPEKKLITPGEIPEELSTTAVPIPKPELTADKFIGNILGCFEKFDKDDTKSVSGLRSIFLTLYFAPEAVSTRKEISNDRNLSDVIDGIHDILVDESISDSVKLTKILNFIMNFGRIHNI